MSPRLLDPFFLPRSVALIGASNRPHSVGNVTAHNLLTAGFAGPVLPVSLHDGAIDSVLAYPSIDRLPEAPELAVICTPAATVPGVIAELGQRGTRAAIVLSAGFGESGDDGRALQQQLLDTARAHDVRIVGPNCVGIAAPWQRLNAHFLQLSPLQGDLALVTQSGAVMCAMADWATSNGIGFSQMVSLGDCADVAFGDMLDWLAADPGTGAILLYIESLKHVRKFMSAARAAARVKPVLAIKAGRSSEGARAAASHTGALAGSDRLFDAAFHRAGILRVFELEELFEAAAALSAGLKIGGGRLSIVTNGGGLGVLATDRLIEEGGQLADLDAGTLDWLNRCLPAHWSKGNPIDIIGDAGPQRYADAVAAALEMPGSDATLVVNCPTATADGEEAAKAVIATVAKRPGAAVLTSWVGGKSAEGPRRLFVDAGIPTFDTPEDAVHGFMHLVRHARTQEALLETPHLPPPGPPIERTAARWIIDGAMADGLDWLPAERASALLQSYGIPIVRTLTATTPEEAAAAYQALGGAVALKIRSRDIQHKTDVGGVHLGLCTAEAVREAATQMAAVVSRARPSARIDGFTVSQMAAPSDGIELIAGAVDDPQFGPVILFGQGGVSVEAVQDTAVELAPLNFALANSLMRRTRISRLFAGVRGAPPIDSAAVAVVLSKISQMMIDLPELAELDINPLVATPAGVLALDARFRLAKPRRPAAARLAICPYPRELEQQVILSDDTTCLVRPIRPEDEPALQTMVNGCTPQDRRLRFFHAMAGLPHRMAARLSQVDYDREMAFVAEQPSGIDGVVRVIADPDDRFAEFGILIRSDRQGCGLGWQLMQKAITYARDRGIGAMTGRILAENGRMLKMCSELGFSLHRDKDDASVMEASLVLQRRTS